MAEKLTTLILEVANKKKFELVPALVPLAKSIASDISMAEEPKEYRSQKHWKKLPNEKVRVSRVQGQELLLRLLIRNQRLVRKILSIW